MSDTHRNICFSRRHKRNIFIGTFVSAILLLILLVYVSSAQKSPNTLQLVHMLFRHGDRTPTETYANDPYKNYNWPEGWGSLTNKGKLQMYELGRILHKRYKSFLEKFSPNDLYAFSSDADRCHMSGATLLAGLVEVDPKHAWNDDLLWEPIPIHSLPRNLDNIVAMKKKCPTYDKALKDAYNSDEIKKLNEENKELYKYLSENCGQDMSNITAVEFLYNTLEIETDNGLKLPFWTETVYPAKLKKIAARSLSIFTETNFMMKMKGGVLIKQIIDHIANKRLNILSPNRKMFLYSGHDISLVNFMRALGFVEDMKPEYGATFILETHLMLNDNFEIKLFYYNSTKTQEPQELYLKECGKPCKFDNFVKMLEPIIPNNWEKECELL